MWHSTKMIMCNYWMYEEKKLKIIENSLYVLDFDYAKWYMNAYLYVCVGVEK